jgi:peptidoglycan/xylan/chitin deacetylase (PgdA/CDA1 family)
MIPEVAAGVAVAAAALHGAYHRNSPLFGRPISRVSSDRPCVALTFDDGPNPRATPLILDALAARGVRATFFVLGRHVERWPELVRRLRDEGHVIGNHGYFHRKLHLKGPVYVRKDLAMGAEAIERAASIRPRLFRAPHGFRNPWVSRIAASLGERTVGWSLGVWDSDKPGVDTIVQRSVDGVRSGSILLLHDGDGYDENGDRMQTAAALPRIVDALLARGMALVTIPE